jgi:hypothetical protein
MSWPPPSDATEATTKWGTTPVSNSFPLPPGSTCRLPQGRVPWARVERATRPLTLPATKGNTDHTAGIVLTGSFH